MSWKGLFLFLGVILVGFVMLAQLSGGAGSQNLDALLRRITQPVARLVETDCTVGIAGTNASITVRGVAPDSYCTQIANSLQRGSAYTMSAPPANPVMCEYTISGYRVTVRDQGLLKLV